MLGSFLPRALLMVFGYAYPAYECYKTVEKNKPDMDQLLFWCHYWTLVAMLTVFERFGDALFAWLPMYSEAKLALFIYLWSSKVKRTTYLYNRFFRVFVAQHEADIDRKISEIKVRTGDIAMLCWQKALNYGQSGVFEILQFVSSHSASQPQNHCDKEQEHGERTTGFADQSESEYEASDQFEGRQTESSVPIVPSSENGTPILPSRKRWIRRLIR